MGDWIKLHRKMLDSAAMSDDWICRLWITCLCRANWKAGWFKGEQIDPGSFAFASRLFAERLKVSRPRLERGLRKLEKWGQITVKPCRAFTVVTICNWSTYQDTEEADRATNDTTTVPPALPQALPPALPDRRREEGKKGKKEDKPATSSRKIFKPPSAEEVSNYAAKIDYPINAQAFVDAYETKGWVVGKVTMKSWEAAVRTWKTNGWGLQKNPGANGNHLSKLEGFLKKGNEDAARRIQQVGDPSKPDA
tara:strand:+ start:219 stop:971 length:753 start_codon:yes stop_codon:yes gene_type:complete